MNERKWFYREYKSQSNKYGINVKLERFMEISISKQEDSFSPLGGFGIWDFVSTLTIHQPLFYMKIL